MSMNGECSGNQKILEQILNVNISLSKKSYEYTGDDTPANGDGKAENSHKSMSMNGVCSGNQQIVEQILNANIALSKKSNEDALDTVEN